MNEQGTGLAVWPAAKKMTDSRPPGASCAPAEAGCGVTAGAWGAMERKGLSRPGGTAQAGTPSPAQLGR